MIDPQVAHFICGLALAALGGLAVLLHSRGDRSLPWSWLAAFCGVQFIAETFQLIRSFSGQTASLDAVRALGTAAPSFVLLEFGRRQVAPTGPTWLKSWIHLPLAALAAGGLFIDGVHGFAAASRYALALPAGLIAAWALCLASRAHKEHAATALSVSALSIALYGVVTAVGFEFGRAITAVGLLGGVWYEHQQTLMSADRRGLRRWSAPVAFGIVAIIGAGLLADRDNTLDSTTVAWQTGTSSTDTPQGAVHFKLETPKRSNGLEQRYKQGMVLLAIAGVVVVVWILAARRYATAQ